MKDQKKVYSKNNFDDPLEQPIHKAEYTERELHSVGRQIVELIDDYDKYEILFGKFGLVATLVLSNESTGVVNKCTPVKIKR